MRGKAFLAVVGACAVFLTGDTAAAFAADGANEAPGTAIAQAGNYFARIRANDAPIGGRFTIYAYMLDSLDAALPSPEPGRYVALHFRDANGKNSFLIPGDLTMRDRDRGRWSRGFQPLQAERLDGHLAKGEGRWALWWIPARRDSLQWAAPADLEIHYGYARSSFVPLKDEDAAAMADFIPWDFLKSLEPKLERTAAELSPPPPTATFDHPPKVKEQRAPQYPKSAKMYEAEGKVFVAAFIDDQGRVTDARVLQSTAPHDLNVSALSAVMDWSFKPARKDGRPVACEIVVPISFSLGVER